VVEMDKVVGKRVFRLFIMLPLGVDLCDLAAIVLSHGHYDHTGGLNRVVEETGKMEVTAHPDIFKKRYAYDLQRIGVRTAQDQKHPHGSPVSSVTGSSTTMLEV